MNFSIFIINWRFPSDSRSYYDRIHLHKRTQKIVFVQKCTAYYIAIKCSIDCIKHYYLYTAIICFFYVSKCAFSLSLRRYYAMIVNLCGLLSMLLCSSIQIRARVLFSFWNKKKHTISFHSCRHSSALCCFCCCWLYTNTLRWLPWQQQQKQQQWIFPISQTLWFEWKWA